MRCLLPLLLLGVTGCSSVSLSFQPYRAAYANAKSLVNKALIVYPGDKKNFLDCNPMYIGDVVCTGGSCRGQTFKHDGGYYYFEGKLALLGATHAMMKDNQWVSTGQKTDVTTYDTGLGVSTASASTYKTGTQVERWALYRTSADEQIDCLEPALRPTFK